MFPDRMDQIPIVEGVISKTNDPLLISQPPLSQYAYVIKSFLGQCASHDLVITCFDHYIKLAVPGGLVPPSGQHTCIISNNSHLLYSCKSWCKLFLRCTFVSMTWFPHIKRLVMLSLVFDTQTSEYTPRYGRSYITWPCHISMTHLQKLWFKLFFHRCTKVEMGSNGETEEMQTFIKLFQITDKAYFQSSVPAGESLAFNDKDSN